MRERTILHCDLNAFYASVELLSRPDLRDVPVAVCGDPKERHGIILAKNERAKGFGVQTAEPIGRALRKCPQLTLLPPHHALYADYSRKVNAIYRRYTDLVEPFGIDESWLDVTGSMHLFGGDGLSVARRISGDILDELGLTISVGISFCKVIAKLGSDLKKPAGITVISRENFHKIVHPLPASSLLYVGKVASASLARIGVRTIGDLARSDVVALEAVLGKSAAHMRDCANGIDPSPVSPERPEAKSVGSGLTFWRNLVGIQDIKDALAPLCEEVAVRLREAGLLCSTVQLTIRDPAFKTITRQGKLDSPTYLARELFDAAVALMSASWPPEKPIRMLTVTGMRLSREGEDPEQLRLLCADEEAKRERLGQLEGAVYKIRKRYGDGAIQAGRVFASDIADRRE